jgi:predicted amidohydrolase
MMKSAHTTGRVKVAVVQHAPVFLNLKASLLKASELIKEAADHGAEVIAFPETWLPGYPVWLDYAPNAALWDHPPANALYQTLVKNSVSIPGPNLDKLLQAAGDTGAYVIMGPHERLGGTLYNTMIYLDRDGQEFGVHRKLMPTYTERLVWGRGDESTLSVLNTDHGILGGLICCEHWIPLARAAMHAKNETMHVAQWPSVKDLHQLASRHYAFEGGCFVLAAGCVLSRRNVLEGYRSLGLASDEGLEILEAMPGEEDDLILNGGSAVIGPDAGYLAGPVFDKSGIIYADLQLEHIIKGQLVLDTNGHYARPDVFRLEVNDQPQLGVLFESQREPNVPKTH